MCEICEWSGVSMEEIEAETRVRWRKKVNVNWPWTDRTELEEWTPEEDEDYPWLGAAAKRAWSSTDKVE